MKDDKKQETTMHFNKPDQKSVVFAAINNFEIIADLEKLHFSGMNIDQRIDKTDGTIDIRMKYKARGSNDNDGY